MTDAPARLDDAALLADALDVPVSALRLIGREPFGDGAVAGFEVRAPDASEESIAYVDTSGTAVAQETGLVLEGVARVWTHPADPHLPALAPVAFDDALGVMLQRLGVATTGEPVFVAYRPGRRAVLRVETDGGRVWIKVVRPRRVERIVQAHRALESAGLPLPAMRGWSPDGVVVLDSAAGDAAPDVAWEPEPLLDRIDELRGELAAVPTGWTARTRIPQRLEWYADRALVTLADHADLVARIRSACARGLDEDAGTPRTIHGDLHLGQLFLAGTGADVRITGLIDVDTAGTSDADEDAAALLSHALASLLLTAPGDARRRWAALSSAASERFTGLRTGALTAIHLLGHALSARTAGDDERAERLLLFADDAAHGRRLRDLS